MLVRQHRSVLVRNSEQGLTFDFLGADGLVCGWDLIPFDVLFLFQVLYDVVEVLPLLVC